MTPRRLDKALLLDRVRAALRGELAAALRVAHDTAEAANHPEARPENDKDTRKLELSYLAAGQATRARELEAAASLLAAVPLRSLEVGDPIESGAVLSLEVAGKPQRVFLLPAGGGTKLELEGAEISVVTPQAPLGRALLGKCAGDVIEVVLGGKAREVEIISAE